MNPLHRLESVLEGRRHLGSELGEVIGGDRMAQARFDDREGVGHFSSRKGCNGFFKVEMKAEIPEAFNDDLVADPFAVHEGPVTVENDGFKTHGTKRRSLKGSGLKEPQAWPHSPSATSRRFRRN